MNFRPILTAALLAACAAAWHNEAKGDAAADQFQVAAGQYQNGRYQEASVEFADYLRHFPQGPQALEARFFGAECLLQLGKYEAARGEFETFLETAGEHRLAVQAEFRAAESTYLLGDQTTADGKLKTFRTRHPEHRLNAFALVYLGEIALAAEKPADAKKWFESALTEYPQGTLADDSRLGLASAHEKTGNLAAAETFYKIVAEQTNSRLAADAQLRLGKLHYGQKQFDKAAAAFAAYAKNFPDHPQAIDAKYWLGRSYLDLGKPESAQETLNSATVETEHPLAPAIEIAKGDAQRALKNVDAAIGHYRRINETWPKSDWADDALQSAIDLAVDVNDHKLAAELRTSFLQQHSDSPLADHVERTWGQSLLAQHEYEQAEQVFSGLITKYKTPSSSDYYLRGLAALGSKNYDLADQSFQSARPAELPPAIAARLFSAHGWTHVGRSNHARGVELLGKYLEAAPGADDAQKTRAQIAASLVELGRLEEAQTTITEHLPQENADAAWWTAVAALAEANLKNQNKEQAKSAYELLAREGNPPEVVAKGLAGLAWMQADSGNLEEASDTFDQLIEGEGKEAAQAALAKARLLEKQNQLAAALTAYNVVLERFPASQEAAEALLASAHLNDRTGNSAKALAQLDSFLSDNPDSPHADVALYERAWVLLSLGQTEKSHDDFLRLHRIYLNSPYWADATYRLAETAARNGRGEEAKRLAELVRETNAENDIRAHALYLLGQLAAASEKWDETLAHMQQFSEEYPASPLRSSAGYWIAEAYYQKDDLAAAAPRFEAIAAASAGENVSWLAMVELRRAQILARGRNWKEAGHIAAGIAERFPGFRQQYEADYLSGRCLASQAKFTEARQAYQQVVQSAAGGRTETAAMAQWMIGETWFHQKKYDEAVRAYTRVVHLYAFPRWQAAALLQAGKCHETQNRWQQAVSLYAQLLRDFPDTDFSSEARRRLEAAQARIAALPK